VATVSELLDDLMGEIPGKDNYGANLRDLIGYEDTLEFTNLTKRKNSAYYSRYYGLSGMLNNFYWM
jgi:hypothetical protein